MSKSVEPYTAEEFEAAYFEYLAVPLDWEQGWDSQRLEVKRLYATLRALPPRVSMERVVADHLRGRVKRRPPAMKGFSFESESEKLSREASEIEGRRELDIEVHFADKTSEVMCLRFDDVAALRDRTLERDVGWYNSVLRSMENSAPTFKATGYESPRSKFQVKGAPFDILFSTSRWRHYATAG